jgi:signal transduction histidine kinase
MSKALLQKNTRILLTWLPIVFLLCSLIFYSVLKMHAHHMQEKQLLLKQSNVWNTFTERSVNIGRHIKGEYDIIDGTAGANIELNEPRDTFLYYDNGKKSLPFEILTTNLQWNGRPYHITTYVSSREVSHLIIKVFITEAIILILLLFAIVFLNRKSSRLLWRPFFSSMKEIKGYDIIQNKSLDLPAQTGTTEFDELNKVLANLIDDVNTAYNIQKQFVENASHEMQTPLAIIRSKLELLINQPNLTEKVASLLADITEANDRLSQMNRTLLLLAKIENSQFPDTEEINISEMLRHLLNNFQQHYDIFPKLTANIKNSVNVEANRSLIEILMSNLLNNAILHNKTEGEINIVLEPTFFLIENTGLPLEANPEELFERFKKGSHQTKTTGLGLALVKQICLLYQYKISYEYQDGWHKVKVIFK